MEYRIENKGDFKYLMSENLNYMFNRKSGFSAVWGATKEEDPDYSPFGPFIADIEVTTICKGPGGKLCPFCSPIGTIINTNDGNKSIENIKIGDIVYGFDLNGDKIRENIVENVYSRMYDGDLIVIEFDDSSILKLTPNHRIILKGGIEVMASDITEDSDIISILDYDGKREEL